MTHFTITLDPEVICPRVLQAVHAWGTIADLARKIGMPRETLSHALNDNSISIFKHLEAICIALNRDPFEFLEHSA